MWKLPWQGSLKPIELNPEDLTRTSFMVVVTETTQRTSSQIMSESRQREVSTAGCQCRYGLVSHSAFKKHFF